MVFFSVESYASFEQFDPVVPAPSNLLPLLESAAVEMAVALVIGLESEGRTLPRRERGREAPEGRGSEEKGLLLELDSEGCPTRTTEGPAADPRTPALLEPTAAYRAGGGLFRRNSTTLPGSPSARRWK